jgi:ABC-2 type transport system ATP-binding protein
LKYAIQTINLTKRFTLIKRYRDLLLHPFKKKEITVLDNINLEVREGEILGLLGPNGAGKTTLIKILCTLVLPTEGNAFVGDYDVSKHEAKIRKLIGYVVSEERSFYWRLTGRQNLKFFSTLNNIPPNETESRIDELAELVRLKDDIDNTFKNYSSGMKQKLAIARGMLTNPQILFLDEPTRNLDPIAAGRYRKFIKNVISKQEGKTVIIATHNMNEAEELCDRIAIINGGRLIKCGSISRIKSILTEKQSYIFKIRGEQENVLKKLQPYVINPIILDSRIESESDMYTIVRSDIKENKNISDIVKQITMAGIDIEAFYPEEYSLEEIFSKVVEDPSDSWL